MKHVPKEARESSANVYVSGGSSQLERLISAQTEGGVTVALVHFTDGAVTHWHTHPGEQVLLGHHGANVVLAMRTVKAASPRRAMSFISRQVKNIGTARSKAGT